MLAGSTLSHRTNCGLETNKTASSLIIFTATVEKTQIMHPGVFFDRILTKGCLIGLKCHAVSRATCIHTRSVNLFDLSNKFLLFYFPSSEDAAMLIAE